MGRAVVIGAGIAGLLTARALSDHAHEVVVVERDDLSDEGSGRRGVPQGRHAHGLLAAGMDVVERWFPGAGDELVAQGAHRGDAGLGHWYQGGAAKWIGELGVTVVCASRPLLESTLRRRLLALPNVSLLSGRTVTGLRLGLAGVSGAYVDGDVIGADLVVDCSGRNTRVLDHLVAGGYPAPPESHVHVDVSYGTRLLRRGDHDIDAPFVVVSADPRSGGRSAVLLPIEGDRWILTLAGRHGDAVPTDDEGFLAFARSLPVAVIAELVERTDALTPVMTHRFTSSQRRHFERLDRLPAGFVAVGDAVSSFNPVYAQGMSSAALQAEQLGLLAARHGLASAALPAELYRRAAKVVDSPWSIAAGADFLHPATTGAKPRGAGLLNRYVRRVHLACHSSPEVWREMWRVQSLLVPPTALMRPRMVAEVLRAARRSPVAAPAAAPERARELVAVR